MQLRDFLSYEEIYIQCHDSPDADALASGFGLYTYFQNHGIKTHLFYTGRFRIRKANLVLMVEKLNIPVEYVDERFTSVLAHRTMQEAGLKKKDRQNKALVDEISATIILQSFMESKK